MPGSEHDQLSRAAYGPVRSASEEDPTVTQEQKARFLRLQELSEDPEAELEELAQIYVKRGLDQSLARQNIALHKRAAVGPDYPDVVTEHL